MTDAQFRFLPWTRRGMVAALTNPDTADTLPARATTKVAITVTNAGSPGIEVSMYGPGDVLGIDTRMIVRTEPRRNASDVEPDYLAAIEFDPPDLPWMFTPAAAKDNRLRPWCVLIVVDRALVGPPVVTPGAPLPAITVAKEAVATELPDLMESWAWAHTQVATSADVPYTSLPGELASAPHRNVSRIVCPRRLVPGRNYIACVVPAFDAGALRGRGLIPDAENPVIGPAWDVIQPTHDVVLPVYYHWEFATGPAGDFESLARKLQPFACPKTVGLEPMYVGAAAEPPLPAAESGSYMAMDGALRSPAASSGVLEEVPEKLLADLQLALEAPAKDAELHPASSVGTLSPPIYGQWHINRHTLHEDAPPWLAQLNLDPRSRVAAGLGAEVERANQEEFMQACWTQVGEVMKANELLSRAWLAMDAARRLLERHLEPLRSDRLLQITAALHPRVRLLPDHTVRAAIVRTSLPDAATDPALRRLTSPQRPALKALARRTGVPTPPSGSAPSNLVQSLAAGRDDVDPAEFGANGLLTWTALDSLELTAGSQELVDLAQIGLVGSATSGDLVAIRDLGAKLVVQQAEQPALPKLPDGFTAVVVSQVRREGALIQSVTVEDPEVVKAYAQAFAEWSTAVGIDTAPPKQQLVPLDVAGAATTLLARLDPAVNVPARVQAMLSFSGKEPGTMPPKGVKLTPDRIMVAPDLPLPVYTYLAKLFPRRFLPGLDEIPSDAVTLLETNPRFIESFLVGLNHEMNSELLWREYPTDQRGTPFRFFWEWLDGGPDIEPIHTWIDRVDLGTLSRGTGSGGQLVLLIRGQLLRRYPNTVIYACKADAQGELDSATERHPVFSGRFDPDVSFVGFDLTDADLKQDDWLFVLQEQPTEPRFGFDTPDGAAGQLASWSDATWAHAGVPPGGHLVIAAGPANAAIANTKLGGLTFATDAAHLAAITLQQPMRIAVDARHLAPVS